MENSMKIGLMFPPEKADKPIVTNLVKYGLTFNILRATISPGKTGNIILEISGTDENLGKSLDYLKGEGIEVKIYTDSVIRYEEKCMHCGACTSVCPSGALVMNKQTWELEFTMDKCLLCGHCVKACPARAIKSFDDVLF
jgi:ferredoxin